MTETTDISFTPEDGWVTVATGSASVVVQLKTNGPIALAVGETEPAGERTGVILHADGESSFAGNALLATDIVRVRALNDGETVGVIRA